MLEVKLKWEGDIFEGELWLNVVGLPRVMKLFEIGLNWLGKDLTGFPIKLLFDNPCTCENMFGCEDSFWG